MNPKFYGKLWSNYPQRRTNFCNHFIHAYVHYYYGYDDDDDDDYIIILQWEGYFLSYSLTSAQRL